MGFFCEADSTSLKMDMDDGTGLRVVSARFLSESRFEWDLFRGYDSLKVLTYSGSISRVFDLLSDQFDFQRFECVFGCERVIRDFSDILAFQQVAAGDTRSAIMKLKDDRHAHILSMVNSGKAEFYVLTKNMSHAKLYLLEDTTSGRKRVLYGSANMSDAAFSGKQTETLVKHDDDDEAWAFFNRMYDDVKANSTDRIELPQDRVKTAKILVPEIPVVKRDSNATLVIHDPDEEEIRIHPQSQVERILKTKEEMKPNVAKFIPPPRNGRQSISTGVIDRIRGVKIVNSQEDADHRYLSFDPQTETFDLCGRPYSLEWDEDKVRNDVRLMIKYFTQYEGAFVGEVPEHQRNYFILWSWMYFSPFMCDLRIRAGLERGGDVFPYPYFAIVYGKSACGKSKLIETVTDSMFKLDLIMPKTAFTKRDLRSLKENYKRLPIYFDDISKGTLKSHGFDVIKDPDRTEALAEYPPFIISMNADFGSFPDEISRRTLMIYTNTALPAFNERLRTSLDSILAEIQQGLSTHLYKRYAADIVRRLRDDPLPKDWLELSSGVLSSIIEELTDSPAPEWSGVQRWEDYAGHARYSRIRNSLDERLRPEAMLQNGSKGDDGWFFEGDHRIIVNSQKDNWGRREAYWVDDVPSTLIDEDASYGNRIVLDRAETERFLERVVEGSYPPKPSGPTPEKRRGFMDRVATILGINSQ